MTIRELREALDGLPQLPNNTVVAVENERGELREVISLESEPEYGVVVIQIGEEVDA
jgi:hypothetical protein